MLTRAALKRQADAIEEAGLPVEEPPFKMLAYYPPVKIVHQWLEMVQVILPNVAKNRYVRMNVNDHIERCNGALVTDTLFMKSLVTVMGQAAESRHEALSKYLNRKSLDQFVNSGFNTSLPLMMAVFKCCNWEKVRERYLYVQIRKQCTEIHFGRREMLLKLDHGRDELEKTIDVLSTILKLFIKARVSAIYVRSYGTHAEKADIVGLQRIIELATLRRNREFVVPPYFKPISNKRINRLKASAEHIGFFVTQTQDRVRIEAENQYSERFLLFDRSREYRYFW